MNFIHNILYIYIFGFIKIHNSDSYDQNEVYGKIKIYPNGENQKPQ